MTGAPYLVDRAGRRFPLAGPVITLGRSEKSDVYVADRRASRRHAEIHWDGEVCLLRDLGSANGTFLNGHPVGEEVLRDGGEIAIAGAVFVFHDPDATLRDRDRPHLAVDEASGDVLVNRSPVFLSPKERLLFDLLLGSAGRACSKDEIGAAVWPEYETEAQGYQVESLVKRLREKLEPDPRHPVMLVTVRGRGYRLVLPR